MIDVCLAKGPEEFGLLHHAQSHGQSTSHDNKTLMNWDHMQHMTQLHSRIRGHAVLQ